MLARRDYTANEVHRKLIEKGYDEAEVAQLIVELRTTRWLDDQRVGANHVRAATTLKGRGKHRIERELAARGLDRAMIREVIGDVTPDDEMTAIETVLRRKRTPASIDRAAERKLFQHLLRRGFSSDLVGKALRKRLVRGDDDDAA